MSGDIELSEEDAAERDRRNQTIREATERADFKRRTQVLQRSLPRPSILDVNTLIKNASENEDPIESAIAQEMALLIANDALKYPVPGAKVQGTSKPLEMFEDKLLERARLELASELPHDGVENRKEEYDKALDEVYGSTELPGLAGYGDDEIDEYQVMTEAFDVS